MNTAYGVFKRYYKLIGGAVLSLAVFFVLFNSSWILAEETDDQDATEEMKKEDDEEVKYDIEYVYLIRGDLETIKAYSLTRISVTNPEVADIVNAEEDEILMVGKQPGQTTVFIWDDFGKRTVVVSVADENLQVIKERIEQLVKASKVEGLVLDINYEEGKVVVSGDIPSKYMSSLDKILQPFRLNLVELQKEEKSEDLVEIEVQIAEINSTLLKEMGVEWALGTTSSSGIALPYTETLPTFSNQQESLLKIGSFSRSETITATVNALIQEGKGRVLSNPRLLVSSGSEASFLVGGEIPIRSTTVNTTGATIQESISFKDYGVSLSVTPTITRIEKIDLLLAVEVSDIDAANQVGNDVAFTTRSATTKLLLDNGQTIVLAGLIRKIRGETIKKVPFLGDIPILGLLFRNRETPSAEQDQELVISLKATVLPQKDSPLVNKKQETMDKKQDEEPKGTTTGPASTVSSVDASSTINTETIQETKESQKDLVKTVEGQSASPLTDIKNEENVTQNQGYLAKKDSSLSSTKETITPQKMVAAESQKQNFFEPAKVIEQKLTMSPKTNFSMEAKIVDQNIPSAMLPYVESVQKKIMQNISYPYEAKEKGWMGTVQLSLKILKDGTLEDVKVNKTSGYNIFDKDALNTAQILAPYEAFPVEVETQELEVVIPIVYSEESFIPDVVFRSKEKNSEVINHPQITKQFSPQTNL